MAWTLVLVAVASSFVNLAPTLPPNATGDETPKVVMPDPAKIQVWHSIGTQAVTTIYTPAVTLIQFPTEEGCNAAALSLVAAPHQSFSDAVCVEIR